MALEFVNVSNIYDYTDPFTLKLGGQAWGVATANVAGTTYLFGSGVADSGISVFSVAADGALTNVFNIGDTADLRLSGFLSLATAEYAGTTYLFASSGHEGGVSLFAVGNDGSLSNTVNIPDDGTLNLNGVQSVGTATIGGATYFFATGYSGDSGVSVFSVGPGGTLTNVFNYPYYDPVAPLWYVTDMATTVVGGNTFLGLSDYYGVDALVVNADGSLTGVAHVADNATLNLKDTQTVATAQVGTTTYLFSAGYTDNGISVFSLGSDGSLTNVANISDDATLNLGGVYHLTTMVHDAITYLLAVGFSDGGMSAFAVGTDGSLTPVANLSDDATMALAGAVNMTSTVVGGHSLAFVAASYEGGVGVFTLDTLPTATNLDQTLSYTEDTGPVAINDIVVTDPDAGDAITATLTLTNAAAGSLTTSGGGTYYPLIGGWTVTGTVAEVNAALAAVSFVPAPNNAVDTSITSYVEDWTKHGPADGIIALNVTAVNDTPVFGNVGPAITSTEQVLAIADNNITIHDAELDALNGGLGDYGGASITIARQGGANPDDFGWIDFAGASFTAGASGLEYNGLVFAGISGGGGTATISFTSAQTPATTALVNEVIQRFMYANGSDNPPASIVVDYTFNDGNAGAQGSGGAGITTASLTVNITPVNDEPVNTMPGAQTMAEDIGGGLVFSASNANAISIDDVDGNSGSETTMLSVSHGTLTFGGSSVGLSAFTNGGASILLTGSVAGINTALSSLTYTADFDYHGADVLTVATSDNGNTGGGALTDVDPVDITINAVGDVVTDNLTTDEDTAITANVLTGTNGASADNFESADRAATGVTQGTHGSVTFLANGAVTYTPSHNFNGADSFTYTVTSGGVTETGVVNVGINAVNDAPVAQNGAAIGNENAVIHGTLLATDIDSLSLTYSRVAQAAHGAVTVHADGTFDYAPNTNYWGTDSFTFKANDGAADSNSATISLTVNGARPATAQFDFNGDGRGDFLWQNDNGTPAVWLMNGTGVGSMGPPLSNSNPAWHAKDAADFNSDGKADVLWQNNNGTPAVWLMDGANVLATGPSLSNPGPTWHANEAADFNGDGKADILWQNDNGAPAVWLMDGVNVVSMGPPLANPGPSWHEKDAADFNGDGKADILWQNDNGTAAVWLMDGVSVISMGPPLPNPGAAWHAEAAGDFNGDGKADILWQNANGTPAVWLMDGTAVLSTGLALPNPGAAWHAKEAEDFNGDGKTDIAWQHDNGTPAVWLMDGTNVFSTGPALMNPSDGWHII